MEGFQGFFRTQNGQKSNSGTGPSTLQPSLSPRPLSSVISSQAGPLHSTRTESQPDTSLIQRIAARFVQPSAPECHKEVTDGCATPQSRGGNPIRQQKLFASSSDRHERLPAFHESHYKKPSTLEMKGTRGGNSVLSVMVLLWLINQREILKDLTDLRSSSVKEQAVLQSNQETIQNHMANLDHCLQSLNTLLQTQQKQFKSEMAYTRKVITLFGVIHLVVMVTILSWSNKTVSRVYKTWWRQLHRSFVQPAVSLLTYYKNISLILVYGFWDKL